MIKNKFLFVAMLFAALSLGFASCDDKKGTEPDEPTQGEQTEQTDQNGSSENNGNKEEEKPEPETPAIDYNGHAYVDLGLPSGLKWATCNVGSNKPEEYGNYYAWGETIPKTNYTWNTYKWVTLGMSDMYGINKYTFADGQMSGVWYDGEGNFIVDNKTILDKEDDAASVNMGGSWRMPTRSEQDELRTECSWTWTTLNGINGYNVEGSNGNSIFLPAAGCRYYSNLDYAGSAGCYWSSSLDTEYLHYAYYLSFSSGYLEWFHYSRYRGQSVRGVIE